MKILIVCSGTKGQLSPFISDQVLSIKKLGTEVSFFQIAKPGFIGYLGQLGPLKKHIAKVQPDIIHAHFGLSGLLANLQRKIPVVTTFHGSDVNLKNVLLFSKMAHQLSKASIVVSKNLKEKLGSPKYTHIIPCGVDLNVFTQKKSVKAYLNNDSYNILFSSSFNNRIKNYDLAQQSCLHAEKKLKKRINLIELKGFSREEVAQLMQSADCLLLTSFSEGSPQFIKEGMACSRPIVATNVGDIEWLFGNEDGHYLTTFEVQNVAEEIIKAIAFSKEHKYTAGRKRIISLGLEAKQVAKQIIGIYYSIIGKS